MANLSSSSFGEYHSATVSVPFNWESQPGTPKSKFHQNLTTLPPLTPPPSYYYNTNSTNGRPKTKTNHSKSSFLYLHNIFPKLRMRSRKASNPSSSSPRPNHSSSSPSNSRSSSTSSSASSVTYYSVPSSPVSTPARNNHCVRGRTSSASSRVHQLEFDSGMLCRREYGSRVSSTTSASCYSYLIKQVFA